MGVRNSLDFVLIGSRLAAAFTASNDLFVDSGAISDPPQTFGRCCEYSLRCVASPNTIFVRNYDAVIVRLENASCFTVQGLQV